MKRPRKRFGTRVELLVAIEDCEHRIRMAMKLGEGHNREADKIRDEVNAIDVATVDSEEKKAHYHKRIAKMKLHRAKAEERIRSLPRRNGDLNRLKDALGRFDTLPFSFLEDASVQL